MSRRRHTESSLDLLLDTICNTFGGVLFLAILICVLLRMTSRLESPTAADEAATPDQLAALQVNLEEKIAELETLHISVSQQALVQSAVRPKDAQALEEWKAERSNRDALFKQRLQAIGRIEADRTKAQEIKRDLDRLSDRHDQAKRSLAEVKNQLEQAHAAGLRLAKDIDELVKAILATEHQTAPLPRRRYTSKREIGLVVRFDRLYVWHRYSSFGNRLGLNDDEFVVIGEQDGGLVTMPKPYAGIQLSDSAPPSLLSRLKYFDPDKHYFAIAIWGDSFDSFQVLKNTLVGLGFEYRLMPIVDGEGIVDRGGTNRQVQ